LKKTSWLIFTVSREDSIWEIVDCIIEILIN
jgi:hypothetical protein